MQGADNVIVSVDVELLFVGQQHLGASVFWKKDSVANFDGNAQKHFARLELIRAAIKERYPNALFFHGLDAEGEIAREDMTMFSVSDILSLMQGCKYVYTMRYHGLVLARVCKVPQIVMGDFTNANTDANTE